MKRSNDTRSIGAMFDAIAHRYDFLNHLLSLGFDYRWRREAIRQMMISKGSLLLDCATGTCDLSLEAMKQEPGKIVGIDISMNMLGLGRKKILNRGFQDRIGLVASSAEAMPFRENRFDAAMVAFGVRNFSDLDEGLSQIRRVLKPGGRLVVLEFSKPTAFPFKQVYFFYFRTILPLIGRIFSHDKNAYKYLPKSVLAFPDGERFCGKLKEAGFGKATSMRKTFGIVTIYIADK